MTEKRITLAHGGGGRLSHEFVLEHILPRFGDGPLAPLPDAAVLEADGTKLVFSTDSYVVQPVFFPGGNIGELAVYGTANDISVAGGRPRWISLALIMEEGFPLDRVDAILDSVMRAAARCGVMVATGDTKVVERGKCDGIYINTSGIGTAIPGFNLDRRGIRPGDAVMVSGGLGEHGMAVIAARKNIGVANGPQSDTAPVANLVEALRDVARDIRFMRDPTRGGLAAVLNETVERGNCGISIREDAIPFSPKMKAVAELLGLDPLHAASEGRIVMVCSGAAAPAALERWRQLPEGADAAQIGAVTDNAGTVVLETAVGGKRLVDMPRGELLPRIC